MRSIEIVTHCYSGEKVPIYHHLLRMQLASIAWNYGEDIYVKVKVFYAEEDLETRKVIDFFSGLSLLSREVIEFEGCPLPKKLLFRRAIGRNIAARETTSDVVWFADCDYLFYRRSLSEAHHLCLLSRRNMVYPSSVCIHKSHDYGDDLIRTSSLALAEGFEPNLDEFVLRREKKAIGGIQIVKGSWCREHGYLDGTNWVNPVDPEKGFRSCKCDVPFRKQVGSSEAVEIGGVYRIRHSVCGRDGGTVDHGLKTRGV